ncbi:ATP-binding protein [Actinophytocola oryzae]|uniref:ATP-binding protein n=1 Tax=Actinophytocola oryzae TaxID=502181 RepID=UPI001414F631|nr:helix-turn-helix domain-containing protein [Actinophytocola oryzae]
MRVPFGVALRRLRERAGLTQERLAELAGLSANAVSSLERGTRRRPYPHTRDALYRALGITDAEREGLEDGITPHASRLPVPPWPVLGRDTEIDTVAGLLDGARVVTLVGPGGVGKTRLALAVAERVAVAAVFVPLAPLRDPADVLVAIATELGLRELGSRPIGEVLAANLRGRALLLVLDNAEHLTEAAPDLARLLANAPAVTALVTSRAPLRIRGEHVHPVPALAPSAAAELFTDRARQAGNGGPADSGVVAAICARLDHLPLAIELAAARTRLLPPARLLDRLGAPLSTVVGGPRDAPERQRTLRRAVAWSHDLLDPPARELLARLSVFTGGWTLDAATAVTGAGEEAVLDGHQVLLDNSLITADGDRFGMLETIRAFAEEQLDGEATVDRHAGYYAALAARAGLWEGDQASRLDVLTAEQDNLRAALRRLAASDRVDELVEACFGMWFFWVVRGGFPPEVSSPDSARPAFVAGWAQLPRGGYAAAVGHFTEAARLARATGDDVVLAWTLPSWAHAEIYRGNPAAAVPLLDEARSFGLPHVDSCVAIGDAHVLIARDRLAEADHLVGACLPEVEARGADWPLAVLLGIQGRLAAVLGDPGRGDRLLARSVRIFARLGDTWGMVHQLTHVADAAAMRADHRRAALLYGAVDAIAEQTGARIFPQWQDLSDRCQAELLTTLGTETYRTLRQEGRRLTPTEVVTLATDPGAG